MSRAKLIVKVGTHVLLTQTKTGEVLVVPGLGHKIIHPTGTYQVRDVIWDFTSPLGNEVIVQVEHISS